MKLFNGYARETNIFEASRCTVGLRKIRRRFLAGSLLIWIFLQFYCDQFTYANANFVNYDQSSINNDELNGMIATEQKCPKRCFCAETNELTCENIDLDRVPPQSNEWPPHFEVIILRNVSQLTTIEKNAFRSFRRLRQIFIENCPELDLIDKFAFKDLQQLRLISISGNRKLRELYKNSFSAIGNDQSLSVHIKRNGLQRIRAMSFRHANNLRELMVEDECFQVENYAFAALQKVDFLVLRGACFVDENAFQNTSRIHNLNIHDSTMDIKRNTFAGLYHVNQIQLRDNRIGVVEEGAFAGMFTVGSVHIQSNRIQHVAPRAFADAENLGTLVISYNTIHDVLESPECLHNAAHKFVFTENTLHCGCEMRWIQFHHYHHENQNPSAILAENYCGREEAFKALSYYQPLGCPQLKVALSPLDESSKDENGGVKATDNNSSPSQRSSGLEQKPSMDVEGPRVIDYGGQKSESSTVGEHHSEDAENHPPIGRSSEDEVVVDPNYFDRVNSRFLWFINNSAHTIVVPSFGVFLVPALMSIIVTMMSLCVNVFPQFMNFIKL